MDKIDLWSVLHLAVLLVVGFTQVCVKFYSTSSKELVLE